MKFNSQICTTKEQSERLIVLGLKKDTADLWWVELENGSYALCIVGQYFPKDAIPAWSLHRLLSMLTAKRKVLLIRVDVDLYDVLIDRIEHEIKGGYFPNEYLV